MHKVWARLILITYSSQIQLEPDFRKETSRKFVNSCNPNAGLQPANKPESGRKVARQQRKPSHSCMQKPGKLGGRRESDGYRLFPPPGARMWSKAMGPPPRKIRPKARVARARGNS